MQRSEAKVSCLHWHYLAIDTDRIDSFDWRRIADAIDVRFFGRGARAVELERAESAFVRSTTSMHLLDGPRDC